MKFSIIIFIFLFSSLCHSEVKQTLLDQFPPKNDNEWNLHLKNIKKQVYDLSQERANLIDERYKIAEDILKLQEHRTELMEFNKRTHEYTNFYKDTLKNKLVEQKNNNEAIKIRNNISYTLLFVVCLMAFIGLTTTILQMIKADKITQRAYSQNIQQENLGEVQNHLIDIELEVQKIKIKTSLVGVFILAISLAFFYVFIEKFYTLDAIDYRNLPELNGKNSQGSVEKSIQPVNHE